MSVSDICTACMCAGRDLTYIGETGLYEIYCQILNEIPIYDLSQVELRLCFECRARLRSFISFKQTVKDNYWELLQAAQQGLTQDKQVAKDARLEIHKAVSVLCPEEQAVKHEINDKLKLEEEVDAIKTEPHENELSDRDDHHSELETFANELAEINTEPPKPKRRVKKKLKKCKEKKRKGRKKKKEEQDSLSEIDAELDVCKENEPVKRKKEKKVEMKYDESLIKLVILTVEELAREREDATGNGFMQTPFRCEDCIVSFDDDDALLMHRNSKHSEVAGEYICETCKVRFVDKSTLRWHTAEHTRRYSCNVCAKRDPSLVAMMDHVKLHQEYTCERCGEVSGSLAKHQTHMSKVHQERPQCAECGKMFSSRKTYKYHLNVIHKGQNRFPCPQCGKIYQWKSNLWRHIKNHKARDSGELYCEPCDKKFSSVATYQQHLKISRRHVSETEYKFMCIECGQKFLNKTRLKDHMDWEHLKKINYRCQLCNKPFKSNTSLYVHVQNVHKNKEEKDNLCHVCGKSYQNIAKLKYHIVAMHSGETPYACAHCPSAFSWYSSLYRHIREVHDKLKIKKPKKNKKDIELHQNLMPPIHGHL